MVEKIVEVPIEQIIEVPKDITENHVSQRTVEQLVDVLAPMVQEEMVNAAKDTDYDLVLEVALHEWKGKCSFRINVNSAHVISEA